LYDSIVRYRPTAHVWEAKKEISPIICLR